MTAYTYVDGVWHEGNPPIMGPMTHAAWLSSIVFDGARAFEGLAPDLDRHCARVVYSARALGLEPTKTAAEIEKLAREGIRKFPTTAELYIRPMFFAEEGFIVPDAASTRFVLSVYDAPLPRADLGFSACRTRYARPHPDSAPTDAKASCLYPNVARAMAEAKKKGFDTAVVLDPIGNVAEFSNANLFLAKDGVVATPAVNRTFLNGITRQRVIALLRGAGLTVEERAVTFDDLLGADEVFSSGNWAKVQAAVRIEDRSLQPGPVFREARRLYWEFARAGGRA